VKNYPKVAHIFCRIPVGILSVNELYIISGRVYREESNKYAVHTCNNMYLARDGSLLPKIAKVSSEFIVSVIFEPKSSRYPALLASKSACFYVDLGLVLVSFVKSTCRISRGFNGTGYRTTSRHSQMHELLHLVRFDFDLILCQPHCRVSQLLRRNRKILKVILGLIDALVVLAIPTFLVRLSL
jgi:hypothetical protein